MKVLVIGSGVSGIQASVQLLKKGIQVHMIDMGYRSKYPDNFLPNQSFSELRSNDNNQHRYFLGDDLEDIPFNDIRTANKLSPTKKHVISSEIIDNFVLNRSFARGGLATAWGAGAMPLRNVDMAYLPFGSDEIAPYYNAVTKDIGLTGKLDDFGKCLPNCCELQSPLLLDTPSKFLYTNYRRKRFSYNNSGLYMGKSWLAAVSEHTPDRDTYRYHDMDFWGDANTSVYRPEWTLRSLESCLDFTYSGGLEVLTFSESKQEVLVYVKATKTGKKDVIKGRALMLAAGVPGSARLAMIATQHYGSENAVPIRTNAHSYVPCFYPSMIGKSLKDRRSSLAQLSILFSPDSDPEHSIFSNIFSYRSMLTYKLLKEMPMSYGFGLKFFKELLPSMIIVTIFHSDFGSGEKKYWLEKKDSSQIIKERIQYEDAFSVLEQQNNTEIQLLAKLRKLGLYKIKRIRRDNGTSAHYSGTLPFLEEQKPLTCNSQGQLRPFSRVWVADGSVIPFMPAVLPTLTYMANARRCAEYLSQWLKEGS